MKKVSVIIPVYNVEKYLNECVDSVLSQTYQNFEIILVDDGSTDKSGDICDKYASDDDRIKVVHKENGGLSDARNCGLKEAQGEYIYFLDSDDFICETALEEAYTAIEKNNCDFVFFDALSFTDENRDYSIKQSYVRKHTYDTEKGIDILGKQLKNKEFHSQVCLMLFSAEFLKSNGLDFVKGITYEDIPFTFEAYCKADTVSQIKASLYHRRYRSGSIIMSRVTEKNFISVCDVLDKVCGFCRNENLCENKTALMYLSKCAFNVIDIYKRLDKHLQKELKGKYNEANQLCRENSFFGDKALEMRFHSYIHWFIYKACKKTLGRLFEKK